MQNKTKNIIITIGFIVILLVAFLANIVSEDIVISTTERRKLAQFPEIAISKRSNNIHIGKKKISTISRNHN